MPSSEPFKIQYRVTWADTDAAQVVHYSNYFRLFEKTEEEFYRHLGFSFTDFKTQSLWFPRVEALCQYKSPARFGDLLEIEIAVEDLKEKSVKYGFDILNAETRQLVANGHVVVVAADRQAGKATRIPKEIVEKLRPFCRQT